MSWTDKQSIKVINYLRDKYKVDVFVETGTFRGINAEFQSKNFRWVYTCEKVKKFYNEAQKRLDKCENVVCMNKDSRSFLKDWKEDNIIFYLDAHFYNPKLPKNKRFVVLDELKSLKNNMECIIIIHDFDNNKYGHITYDGISLDMKLLREDLLNVNPSFNFYTNNKCDIVKPNSEDIVKAGLNVDYDTLNNLEYAWSKPRLTKRGLLYCLPTELNKKEITKLGVRKIK